jgi:type I restriction enzyme S subunit
MNYLQWALYVIGVNRRSIKQTTGIQNIDIRSYLNELASVPDLDEQRRLAGNICQAVENFIRARVATEKETSLLREYRSRLIADVVTGKRDVRKEAESLPDVDPEELATALCEVSSDSIDEVMDDGD